DGCRAFHRARFSPDGKTLVTDSGATPWYDNNGSLHLWEVTTGKPRGKLTGHSGRVSSLSFSPDGRLLASGSADTTVLVWDVRGFAAREVTGDRELSPARLAALWEDLAGPDAARAYQGICTLGRRPGQAVPFLRERLRPVGKPTPERLRQL